MSGQLNLSDAYDNLHSNIREVPLSATTRKRIITELLGIREPLEPNGYDYESYFKFYHKQCQVALRDQGRHLSIQTHREAIELASQLSAGKTKDDIIDSAKDRPSQPARRPDASDEIECIKNAVELVTRLLLMVNVGSIPYSIQLKSHRSEWTGGTIRDFASNAFPLTASLGLQAGNYVKFEKIFNARNLQRIAGIQIIWTDDIAKHLQMLEDDTSVGIFHYASYLRMQESCNLFPDGFVVETLQTLALLFPQWDEDTKKWLEKLQGTIGLDSGIVTCGRILAEDRCIENFRFWHDRLVILKQSFDQAEPSTIQQWWFDRRRRVQWYTFWVAIIILALTIFFGIVQCVEGALHVYKAFYPS